MYWISHKKRDCWISFIVKRTKKKKSILNMKIKSNKTAEIKVIYTSVRTPRNVYIHSHILDLFISLLHISILSLSSSSLSSFVLYFVKYFNYGKMEPEIAWKYPFFRYSFYPSKCEIFFYVLNIWCCFFRIC